MSKYTKVQWQKMADSFNSKGILGKLLIIKSNPELLRLECDKNGWVTLRMVEDEDNLLEHDLLFEFPGSPFEDMLGIKAVFELMNIKIDVK